MGQTPPPDLYRRRRVTETPPAAPPGRWARLLAGARWGAILGVALALGLLYGQLYLKIRYPFDPQVPVLLVFGLAVVVALLRR